MKSCANCGAALHDESKFCHVCGVAVNAEGRYRNAENYARGAFRSFESFNDTKDDTAMFHEADIIDGKTMAVLAYIGALVFIPFFGAKHSPFARYHTNQGLILFVLEVAFFIIRSFVQSFFSMISGFLGSICGIVFQLASLAFLVYIIIGVINAASGKAKELPIIGWIRLI